MPPTYYRGCWHVVRRGFLVRYRQGANSYSSTCSSLTTEFYDPKTFFTHAALLRQTCVHCGRFPTAASRRSLGRVSVPMWPSTLSGRLPVAALVGHYPTNKLIGRGLIPHRNKAFHHTLYSVVVCGIRPSFPGLSHSAGQITHVLLTRSPLEYPPPKVVGLSVRLACVKHAASVRPEPGSNSPTTTHTAHTAQQRVSCTKTKTKKIVFQACIS